MNQLAKQTPYTKTKPFHDAFVKKFKILPISTAKIENAFIIF